MPPQSSSPVTASLPAEPRAEQRPLERTLAGTKSLQDTLFAELKGRIKEDDSSVPQPDGPYAYYARYRQGGQHPLLCREPRDSAAIASTKAAGERSQERLLLDGDALAQGKAF